jgi:hypothetical protein
MFQRERGGLVVVVVVVVVDLNILLEFQVLLICTPSSYKIPYFTMI